MKLLPDDLKVAEKVKSVIETLEKEDFRDIFKPSFLQEWSLGEYIDGKERVQTISKQLAPMFEYRVLQAFSDTIKDARSSGADFKYLENDKDIELKTSQSRNGKSAGFTGNKISTKNCDHLLINYKVNYDKKITEDNTGIIEELYVGYIKDVDPNWWTSGSQTTSNFASLNVPREFKDNVIDIIGSSKKARKYVSFKPEKRREQWIK